MNYALKERKAIVTFLRSYPNVTIPGAMAHELANAIEQGKHVITYKYWYDPDMRSWVLGGGDMGCNEEPFATYLGEECPSALVEQVIQDTFDMAGCKLVHGEPE